MADNNELKVKSFRIDEETNEKLREIMKDFPNQNLALQKMVEVYELEQSKETIADRKADIEEFEKYVSCLVRMYMTSLESNQNQKELIRGEFDGQLRSKDSIIQDLQEKLTVAKQLKEEATIRAKAHANENEDLKQAIERLNTEYSSKMDDMQDMLKDKDSLNKALSSSCNDLKAKVEQMAADAEHNKALCKDLDNIKAEYDKLLTSYNSLEAVCNDLKVKNEETIAKIEKTHSEALERVKEQEQIKLDKAILELEKKHQEQLQQLKAEQQKEIDKYQSKYLELLEQLEQSKAKRTKTTTKQE